MNTGPGEVEREDYLARIFAAIAHEIRNPLQGIMASAAALGCQLPEDASYRTFLDMIVKETTRIHSIINEMLQLSLPVVIGQQPFPVKNLIEEAISGLAGEIQSRGALIQLITPDYPLPVIGDGNALSNAFMAVLRNAIEASETQAIVEVSVTKEGEIVAILIQDHGAGISTENAPLIFEPFFSTKPKRAGLGLTIAQRIFRSHGGQIQVKSEGDTTDVLIRLPGVA